MIPRALESIDRSTAFSPFPGRDEVSTVTGLSESERRVRLEMSEQHSQGARGQEYSQGCIQTSIIKKPRKKEKPNRKPDHNGLLNWHKVRIL
jgi:hypothetical protein